MTESELTNQIDDLRRQNAELRECLKGMLENYIELKRISLCLARSDAPNWVGAGMTPEDDIHIIAARKALADQPEDSSWNTLLHDMKKFGEDVAKLAKPEGLKTCPDCNRGYVPAFDGEGNEIGEQPCQRCGGTGTIVKAKSAQPEVKP